MATTDCVFTLFVYLNSFLHGDQVAAFLIVLMTHLAFLTVDEINYRYDTIFPFDYLCVKTTNTR